MPPLRKNKKPIPKDEITLEAVPLAAVPAEKKQKSTIKVKKELKFVRVSMTSEEDVEMETESSEESNFEEELNIEEEITEEEIPKQEEISNSTDNAELGTDDETELDTDLDSDDELDYDEKVKTKKIHVFKAVPASQPDFFELLRRMPELDQISLTDSIVREVAIRRTEVRLLEPIEEVPTVDEVDDDDVEIIEQEYELDETMLDTAIESKSTSEFDFDFYDTSDEEEVGVEKPQPLTDEHLFEAILKKQLIQTVAFKESDAEEKALIQEMIELKNDTNVFLQAIIEAVVQKAEHRDALEILRKNLSKVKLFRELDELLQELNIEAKINEFVNKKCVYYFRRQKVFRQITPDSKTHLDTEVIKYKSNLRDLDSLLGREVCTKEVISKKIEETKVLLESVKEEEQNAISQFEDLIRITFKIRENDHLNAFVERRLMEISDLRKEVSKVREVFIKRQHTKKSLLEKTGQLEKITETLTLHDYEEMLIEQYALSKKLEEKTERYEKLSREFFHNLEFVAHIKEKQCISSYTILEQLKKLNAAEAKRRSLREHIFKLKTSRMQVKKQIREVSSKHGLLSRPALLVDFDLTAERVREMRAKVDGLKAQVLKIEQKINALQKCGA